MEGLGKQEWKINVTVIRQEAGATLLESWHGGQCIPCLSTEFSTSAQTHLMMGILGLLHLQPIETPKYLGT